MYTTPADAGQFTWNDGTGVPWGNTMVDCATTEATCVTGEANTILLAGLTNKTYEAATYCQNLAAHGRSDWFLPARDEYQILYDNHVAIGGFDTSGNFYWSSSEIAINSAAIIRFNDGLIASTSKNTSRRIRCVRTDPAP